MSNNDPAHIKWFGRQRSE